MTKSILHVYDVKRSGMTFTSHDGTNSPQVTTTSNHAQVARFELDEIHDFVGGNVQLDCVVNFNQRVRIANSASIMGCDERNSLWASLNSTNLAQLILR